MKSIRILFAIVAILGISCSKKSLDQPALAQLDESKLANKAGIEGLLIGAYAMLDGITVTDKDTYIYAHGVGPSNWIYGSICGSEAYKGSDQGDQPPIHNLETFQSTAYNDYLATKWVVLYAGVARANTVLRVMKKAQDLSREDQRRIAGEARFLRGHYHFEAAKIWNKVPYADETITYDAGNFHLSNDTILRAIENDFKFAADSLPSLQSAVGRANKWAAKAFLAKTYLFEKKYAEAKPLLEEIIKDGVTAGGKRYTLMTRFADVFNAETKNSEEHVFSAQMSVNDGGQIVYPNGFVDGGHNGNLGDEWNYPMSDDGNNVVTPCCGFFQPSQWLVNHFKTDPHTGLPDLDNFNVVSVKSDEGIPSDKPFAPDTGAFDPRLDWTVGRRGIPYHDWGVHPGGNWVRDVNWTYGPYSPKKNVFYKSQAGTYSFGGGWSPMASAVNVNIIRFADVLLWAAEVEVMTSGSLDKAEEYVNMVRNRIADHREGWVHKYVDDNNPQNGSYTDSAHLAAKYVIRPYPSGDFAAHGPEYAIKAVRFERVLELGMEGHRFFDLVRWGIADVEIKAYLEKEKLTRTYLNDAVFTKGCSEYFAIPQLEIDRSAGSDGIPKMVQNPCY